MANCFVQVLREREELDAKLAAEKERTLSLSQAVEEAKEGAKKANEAHAAALAAEREKTRKAEEDLAAEKKRA